jgi:hypothetical protein
MWLTFPAGAWTYCSAWGQLPARMAVHFGAKGEPNGYTSREGAVCLGLGILLVMLVLFTLATLIIDAMKPSAFWPALLISYLVVGFGWYGNYRIVKFSSDTNALHSRVTRSGESNSQFSVARPRSN